MTKPIEPIDQLTPSVKASMAATFEVCGAAWSRAASNLVAVELLRYHPEQVLQALERCRREVTGKLTLAAIVERIDDGRPTADEAWSQVSQLTESDSAVLTDETLAAWRDVRDLLAEDKVGARMAFRESYRRRVTKARADGLPVQWVPSLGHDPAGREETLRRAVEQGKLAPVHGAVVGGLCTNRPEARRQLEQRPAVALLPPAASGPRAEKARALLGSILDAMGDPERMQELQEALERQQADEQERRDARARAGSA